MQKIGPKDVLLHLFSMLVLYASIVGFLVLVFQYINLFFPDVLEGRIYTRENALGSIRWSLAMLVVVFPSYLGAVSFLRKEYELMPERRELRVRKWLIYITLFAAAVAIGGDLISLIFRFLDGELTARFLFKVLAVFFVAGSVFFYYFMESRSYERRIAAEDMMRYFAWSISIIVIATVIAGFFIAGSPTKRRMERFDAERVENLQYISWQIQEYWRAKELFPSSLSELNDDLRGVRIPLDPQTKKEYEYIVKDTFDFSLCAEFNYPSQGASYPNLYPVVYAPTAMEKQEIWDHGIGKTCFERTIDPDFFTIEKAPMVR